LAARAHLIFLQACSADLNPIEQLFAKLKHLMRAVQSGTVEGTWQKAGALRSINALAETMNGLYKTEVIHRREPWRSFKAVEFATLEWVDWFNKGRLLAPIGYIPPSETEERTYALLDEPAVAA
jgi:hypothetical protein